MSLTRWPNVPELGTMRDAMTRMLDDPFFRSPFGNLVMRMEPAVPLEIVEHETELEVRAAVPGFAPEQIDVQLQGDLLTLRGTQEEQHEGQQGAVCLREWKTESFQRTVRLPVPVDPEAAQAHFVNGVLSLKLPKVPERISRKIEVKS